MRKRTFFEIAVFLLAFASFPVLSNNIFANKQKGSSNESQFEFDCDNNPEMVLVIEVTIPHLIDKRQFEFPFKRRTSIKMKADGSFDLSGHLCVSPLVGGSGESFDLKSHFQSSVMADHIQEIQRRSISHLAGKGRKAKAASIENCASRFCSSKNIHFGMG